MVTINKRDYLRVKNEFNVKLEFEPNEDSVLEIDKGVAINVSASGLQLRLDNVQKPGSFAKVSFLKPNSFDFFAARARIVWIEPDPQDSSKYIAGLKFENLSDQEKNQLHFYLVR